MTDLWLLPLAITIITFGAALWRDLIGSRRVWNSPSVFYWLSHFSWWMPAMIVSQAAWLSWALVT